MTVLAPVLNIWPAMFHWAGVAGMELWTSIGRSRDDVASVLFMPVGCALHGNSDRHIRVGRAARGVTQGKLAILILLRGGRYRGAAPSPDLHDLAFA